MTEKQYHKYYQGLGKPTLLQKIGIFTPLILLFLITAIFALPFIAFRK